VDPSSSEGDVRAVHVVIMGCGRVGAALAHSLVRLEHSVAIIDQDRLAFRRLGENFGAKQITGMGFDRETLISADIEQADAFAAVSSGDNSNIIAARVARETFGVHRVVARIYDAKRAEVYERLGIPTVATVPWTASRLLRSVLGEASAEAWRDPSGKVSLLSVVPHEGWIGHSLAEFEAKTGTRVGMITRFGLGELPVASTLIQSGDSLHVFVSNTLAETVRALVAAPPEGAAR
jgi:trk system potassium uptake protein TrkA